MQNKLSSCNYVITGGISFLPLNGEVYMKVGENSALSLYELRTLQQGEVLGLGGEE